MATPLDGEREQSPVRAMADGKGVLGMERKEDYRGWTARGGLIHEPHDKYTKCGVFKREYI